MTAAYRGIIRLLPVAFLGIATTLMFATGLLVADLPATRSDITFRDRERFNGEGLGRIVVRMAGSTGSARYDAAVYPTCVSTVSGDARSPEDAVPAWALAAVLPWSHGARPWPQSGETNDLGSSTETAHVEAAGWPMLAVWRTVPRDQANLITGGGSPDVTKALGQLAASAPNWRPIWPGLFVDAAVFGVLWLAGLAVPRLAWCASRVLRGHCARCGYDLAGLVRIDKAHVRCPECGRTCRVPHPSARRALRPAV